MLYYFVGSICVLIAFAVLAITVFVATLEFKLVTLASMVFVHLPFGKNKLPFRPGTGIRL